MVCDWVMEKMVDVGWSHRMLQVIGVALYYYG